MKPVAYSPDIGSCDKILYMEGHDFQKRTGKAMIILGWITVLGLLTLFFSDYLTRQYNPNQNLTITETKDGAAEVRLQRNRYGHYVASGFINNQPVTFLLDTGATHISIPGGVARDLGLEAGVRIPVATANGQIEDYSMRLDSVSIGGIELNNVRANINPYMDMDDILLGIAYSEESSIANKLAAIKLFKDFTMARSSEKDVTVTQVRVPQVFIPEKYPDDDSAPDYVPADTQH